MKKKIEDVGIILKKIKNLIQMYIAVTESIIIGMELEEATDLLDDRDVVYRIVSIDNTAFMITQDYKPERLNLFVEGGIIVKFNKG